MNKPLKNIFLFVSVISIYSSAYAIDKAIYGKDNRQEAYDVADAKYAEFARSVAAQIKNTDLTFTDSDSVEFSKKTLHEFNYGLTCNNMRFREQYVLAQCSGFLIAPDVLLTAGHCVRTQADCNNAKWVFDYVDGVENFSKENIYSCKQILDREEIDTWHKTLDYAVIKLDRTVTNRAPLKIRTKGKPKKNDPIAVIGFPQGLPMKFTDEAQIKKITFRTMFANTDTFVGNSGSPVFNLQTNEVEGLIYRGEDDLKSTANENGDFCIENIIYPTSALGEGMIRVNKIRYLKKLL